MNRKLVVLALVAAMAAPAVLAQTSNPVTLYGRVWGMFEVVESKGEGALPRRNRVSNYSSLLGVRGSEDLGGGLKAIFQLETRLPIDAATTVFADRNSGIGLGGNWGTVMLGRWDTPFKTTQVTPVDPFRDNALGDLTSAAVNQGNFSIRATNIVQYWSPDIAGFELRAAVSANEGRTPTANPYLYSFSIKTSKGPYYAAIAYEKHRESNGDQATTPGVSEEGLGLAGSYWVGPVNLMGQVGRYKKTRVTTETGYSVGFEWGLGKGGPSWRYSHLLLASYQHAKGGSAAGAPQAECQVMGVGYKYHFSRRTFFLVDAAKVNNKVERKCNFGGGGTLAGQKPQGISVGFQHIF